MSREQANGVMQRSGIRHVISHEIVISAPNSRELILRSLGRCLHKAERGVDEISPLLDGHIAPFSRIRNREWNSTSRVIRHTTPSARPPSPAYSRCSCPQQSSCSCTPRPWSWSLPPACRLHPRGRSRFAACDEIHELLESCLWRVKTWKCTHTSTLALQSVATTAARAVGSRTEALKRHRMLGSCSVADATILSSLSRTPGSPATTPQTCRI
jgi:hypothetical protein